MKKTLILWMIFLVGVAHADQGDVVTDVKANNMLAGQRWQVNDGKVAHVTSETVLRRNKRGSLDWVDSSLVTLLVVCHPDTRRLGLATWRAGGFTSGFVHWWTAELGSETGMNPAFNESWKVDKVSNGGILTRTTPINQLLPNLVKANALVISFLNSPDDDPREAGGHVFNMVGLKSALMGLACGNG